MADNTSGNSGSQLAEAGDLTLTRFIQTTGADVGTLMDIVSPNLHRKGQDDPVMMRLRTLERVQKDHIEYIKTSKENEDKGKYSKAAIMWAVFLFAATGLGGPFITWLLMRGGA